MATRNKEVSHYYDKEALLSEHENLRSSIRINTPHQVNPEAIQIQSGLLIELNKFEAIRICDLSPNSSNQNKLIYSTQISPIAVAEPICFIVEDEYENACRVILFALTDTSHLVKGVKLAFCNPVYRMTFDGKYSLIVHNISDVFILGMYQSVESYLKLSVNCESEISKASTPGEYNEENNEQVIQRQQEQQTSINIPPPPPPPIVPVENGLNLSEIGNNLYKEGQYSQAIIQYTSAIEVNDKTAKFYSNRAMCYNKLEEFENALSDFQKANLLEPDSVKYQYWVALIWSRIGNHKLSLNLLKKIHTNDELYNSSVKKLITQQESYLQNIDGVFDFDVVKGESIDIADYIGPIQILNSPDKGRGIFTTRNVKKGEKLCVVKAIETKISDHINCPCRSCRKNKFISLSKDKTLYPKLIEKAKKSKLTTVRIISLCDRSITNVNIDLYSGCGYEFAKNFDTTPYPMEKLLLLTVKNMSTGYREFEPEILNKSFEHMAHLSRPRGIPNSTLVGIWLLPSFINHSCIANIVKLYVGNICIVRAITDIPEGQELFCNYTPLSLFTKVEDRCTFLNFLCSCNVCEFERRPDVRKIILHIFALEDRLFATGIEYCIVRRIYIDEFTTEFWLHIKAKMVKLAKQLIAKHTDKIIIGSFLRSIITLLFCRPIEIDRLDLLQTFEPYYCPHDLESFYFFWIQFNTYIYEAGLQDDHRYHYVAMKIDELLDDYFLY
ncbi:Protein unc-45-like protein A [Oopsacas minuta]|uniref:Protein unc-45-like protein A n=1 Tax=Oopsacas minuta TaxID=111878 RepID=A0AAV7KL75_9METZ|nr:Protein unc-45-like protein A [Oopsacas minuta]